MAIKEINKTKILVKVHEPLITIIQHKIEAACLKRDAYLDKALQLEAKFLRKEIETPNSDKAKNYIAAQLSDLKLKPLNLLLSTETVDLINEVCKEKNIPRDAFINRFFLLLIASDTVLTAILYEFLKEHGDEQTIEEFVDLEGWADIAVHDPDGQGRLEWLFAANSALDSIEEFISERAPLMRIRIFINYIIETRNSQTMRHYYNAMYSYPFKKEALQKLPAEYGDLKVDNSLGFNTAMTDEQIDWQEEIDSWDSHLNTPRNEKDKLLVIIQNEKRAKAEKEKQARQAKLEKATAKSEGESK